VFFDLGLKTNLSIPCNLFALEFLVLEFLVPGFVALG
jgi:hypothetical protein